MILNYFLYVFYRFLDISPPPPPELKRSFPNPPQTGESFSVNLKFAQKFNFMVQGALQRRGHHLFCEEVWSEIAFSISMRCEVEMVMARSSKRKPCFLPRTSNFDRASKSFLRGSLKRDCIFDFDEMRGRNVFCEKL